MLISKKETISDQNLVWLDLEMTGLDPNQDVILEIACIITNNDLEPIAYGPSIVIQQPKTVLDTMDKWCITQHGKSGLTDKVLHSTVTIQDAEKQVLDFVKKYCKPQTAPLCGNSIHQDRAFLRVYMPELYNFFHYRIIDVSSIKEIIRRWYPEDKTSYFFKPDNHRAFEDVKSSINELSHYRNHFFWEK